MSLEVYVYTTKPPFSGSDLIALAARKKLELRLVIPWKCVAVDAKTLQSPLTKAKQDYLVYCWSSSDKKTTLALDKALAEADQAALVALQDQFGWFDFACRDFNFRAYWKWYRKFWKNHPDEIEELASIPQEILRAMRAAKYRYFFRCGLRPRHCANYLDKVARLVRDACDGFLA